MDKLWEVMNEEDRQIFGFDIRELDWLQYIETYVQVSEKYQWIKMLLKGPADENVVISYLKAIIKFVKLA